MKSSLSIPLRLSSWAHVFTRKGRGHFALYHSLNMELVFLRKKYLEVIELLRLGTTQEHLHLKFGRLSREIKGVIRELQRTGLVVTVESNDMELLEEKRKAHVFTPGLETLYLIVTDSCNLRCRYCFINGNMPKDYRPSMMSFDVAKEAIDMFFRNLSLNPPEYANLRKTIFFYGGEPFLNFDLIKRTVEYIESAYESEVAAMGSKLRLAIVSNGTMINEEIARFIGAHENLDIAISIDGPKEIHDVQRVCVDGCGSFNQAINGVKLLRTLGRKRFVSLSATIGEHNIDKLPTLLRLHRKYGFASINLNPLVDTANDAVGAEYMRKASRRMIEYFELARKEGVYEDRIMRKAKSFMEKRIHAYDCQALGAQLVCTPNGQLGVCHEGIGARQFFFAKVLRDFDFHHNEVIGEWKRRTPLNMPQCFGCPAIAICGGGCAYGAWLRNGSIWSVDDRFCIHSLATLEWLIWDVYKRV